MGVAVLKRRGEFRPLRRAARALPVTCKLLKKFDQNFPLLLSLVLSKILKFRAKRRNFITLPAGQIITPPQADYHSSLALRATLPSISSSKHGYTGLVLAPAIIIARSDALL